MVRFTSALLAIVASSISLVAAQSYEDFTIDATVAAQFAGPVRGVTLVTGSIADGKDACDASASCIGVICRSTNNQCVTFEYSSTGVTDTGAGGYDSIHFRYAAPSGPSCRTTLGDEFTTSTGQCTCGSDELENQNTAFGCILAVTPSQLVQRRRIANNRIVPGHVRRAVFERRRVNEQAAGNLFV